jgi:formate/nitrite transporter FocA (FNT family)
MNESFKKRVYVTCRIVICIAIGMALSMLAAAVHHWLLRAMLFGFAAVPFTRAIAEFMPYPIGKKKD